MACGPRIVLGIADGLLTFRALCVGDASFGPPRELQIWDLHDLCSTAAIGFLRVRNGRGCCVVLKRLDAERRSRAPVAPCSASRTHRAQLYRTNPSRSLSNHQAGSTNWHCDLGKSISGTPRRTAEPGRATPKRNETIAWSGRKCNHLSAERSSDFRMSR